jgi:tripartite-type tricarboxylate transporter receptor subunit TctC
VEDATAFAKRRRVSTLKIMAGVASGAICIAFGPTSAKEIALTIAAALAFQIQRTDVRSRGRIAPFRESKAMMRTTRRQAVAGGLSALALPFATPARAQKLSDRTITVIVPFTAGSGPDLLGRIAAEEIRARWGQAVIVDNKPGASGNIGAAAASRAVPDGHTLVIWINTVLMNAALSRTLGYEPVKGFTPIVEIARGSLALGVHASAGISDIKSLVAASQTRPDGLRYASPGRGTPHHMAMELFKLRTGAKLDHIPYSGTGGAVNDFVAGHVPVMFIPIHVGLQHARAGAIRLLAVGSETRTPLAPDVPTLAEAGVANAEVDLWYALSAPAGTPPDIVQRLNAVMNEALADPKVRANLEGQGLFAVGGTASAFAARIDAELPRWQGVVRDANITADN